MPAPHGEVSSPVSVKIVVSGGFGVGKTTFVGAISEIEPLLAEADTASAEADDRGRVPGKATTVALDIGRVSLDGTLRLYLFGTPGQEQYSVLRDDLLEGALGAVVLLNPSRIEDCLPAIDYFEEHGVAFLIAVNVFENTPRSDLAEVREALGVDPGVPVVECDARHRDSAKNVLVALTEEVLTRRVAEQEPAATR